MKYINQYPVSQPGESLFWDKNNIEKCLEQKAQFKFNSEFVNQIYNGIESRMDTFAASTTVNCFKGPIQDTMSYDLNFSKLGNGAYELSSFHARLHSEKGSEHDRTHTFGRESKVPVLEDAYHLLDGRAVHHEIATTGKTSFQGWVQFYFNQKKENDNYQTEWFLGNHGFDLHQALKQYPIKELFDPVATDGLIEYLKRGELEAVTIKSGSGNTTLYVQADPKNKSVIFYDRQLKIQQPMKLQSRNLKSSTADSKSSINDLKHFMGKTRRKFSL